MMRALLSVIIFFISVWFRGCLGHTQPLQVLGGSFQWLYFIWDHLKTTHDFIEHFWHPARRMSELEAAARNDRKVDRWIDR